MEPIAGERLASQVLQNYGIAGLVVLSVIAFCGWIVHKILVHFMETSRSKDQQVMQISERFSAMGEKFSEALNGNTKAIDASAQAKLMLAHVTENVVAEFERLAEKNKDEHAQILDYVRDTKLKMR